MSNLKRLYAIGSRCQDLQTLHRLKTKYLIFTFSGGFKAMCVSSSRIRPLTNSESFQLCRWRKWKVLLCSYGTILFLRIILRRFFPSEVLIRHFKVTELVFLAIYQASRKLLKKRILGETSRLRWSDEDDANISALRFVYNLFHASRLVFRKSKLKSGLNCNFQIPC